MNILGIIIGILLASNGLMFIFLYTNLFTLGYTFLDFVKFISKRLECLNFVFGIILILLFLGRGYKNVLLLRHTSKLWK